MSARSAIPVHPVAPQLAAALDAYADETQRMLAAWPDLERYRAFSERIELVRQYSSGLPEARAQWLELLIAHAELVHALWRTQYGDRVAAPADIDAVRDNHARCVAALRDCCLPEVSAIRRG